MGGSNNQPNLIVPGAGKSGTSSLHVYLNMHPKIFMSELKEPSYFYKEDLYLKKFNWYSSLFELGEESIYRGESSTAYLSSNEAIQRMKNDLDKPKFIIILRNPIDRIISHYFWLKSKGLEYKSIWKAVDYDKEFPIGDYYNIYNHGKNYLQYSLYGKWVEKYHNTFGQKNVLIITTESMKHDVLKTMNQCFSFLNLDPLDWISGTKHNITEYKKVPLIWAIALHHILTVNERQRFYRLKEKVLPDQLKEHIMKYHNWFSKKQNPISLPTISKHDRLWLKSLLVDDVKKLKSLTGKEYTEWVDFKI